MEVEFSEVTQAVVVDEGTFIAALVVVVLVESEREPIRQ